VVEKTHAKFFLKGKKILNSEMEECLMR